ncbi:MAG: PrgI family protein [Minisyncoccia bacterium]
MEYQVPQFIEVEDKIIGPLTLRQFIYVGGGAGLVAIFLLLLPLVIAVVLAIPVAALAAALAFYKVNGKPFIEILEFGLYYFLSRRLYLWKKEKKPVAPSAAQAAAAAPSVVPKEALSRRKLEELAWSLDVKSGVGDTSV